MSNWEWIRIEGIAINAEKYLNCKANHTNIKYQNG